MKLPHIDPHELKELGDLTKAHKYRQKVEMHNELVASILSASSKYKEDTYKEYLFKLNTGKL